MKFFNALVFTFYTFIILALGILSTAVSLGIVSLGNAMEIISLIYGDTNLRLLFGLSGFLLIVIAFGAVQISLNKFVRKKAISFDRPEGQITVSFSAIEHFVKRLFMENANIKEIKPVCRMKRKQIEILNKVALWQSGKLPEITENIQTVTKSRLQQMLGVEDDISVKIEVYKIVPKEARRKGGEKQGEIDIEAPYQYKD